VTLIFKAGRIKCQYKLEVEQILDLERISQTDRNSEIFKSLKPWTVFRFHSITYKLLKNTKMSVKAIWIYVSHNTVTNVPAPHNKCAQLDSGQLMTSVSAVTEMQFAIAYLCVWRLVVTIIDQWQSALPTFSRDFSVK